MYVLIIKDGLITRHIGPYASTQMASKDLQRLLGSCSSRAKWQIHELEKPFEKSFSERVDDRSQQISLKAS